jgi:asparagine synthase (glutamine-hydrolysing)
MAHSIEIRVPLVDTTLLRQFVEIPGLDVKQEKRLIVRTVAPELPEAVLTRPKTGFAVPIHQWLNPEAANSVFNLRSWGRAVYRSFAPQ